MVIIVIIEIIVNVVVAVLREIKDIRIYYYWKTINYAGGYASHNPTVA